MAWYEQKWRMQTHKRIFLTTSRIYYIFLGIFEDEVKEAYDASLVETIDVEEVLVIYP